MSILDIGKEKAIVHEYEEGLLYKKGEFKETLGKGLYRIKKGPEEELLKVDMRTQSQAISGQEILTKDSISLKLNVIARFKITDSRKSVESIQNYRTSLYEDVQMVVRGLVRTKTLEELLATKDIYTEEIKKDLEDRCSKYGVVVESMELKDVILPGALKALQLKEIEAKKEGQIALEKARTEVASTRALVNAAILVKEHPEIMELKVIEALNKLSESKNQIGIQLPPELFRNFRR